MNTLIMLIFLILIFTMGIAGLSFAPWVPTFKRDLKRIADLADLQPGQKFYELGSGTGKVLFYINKMTGAETIGFEIGLPFYLISRVKQVFIGNQKVKIKYRNFFKQGLSDADVVYFFGIPKTIKDKLRQKLEKELKPETKVISYAFAIEDWQPVKVDKPGERDIAIYLYIR